MIRSKLFSIGAAVAMVAAIETAYAQVNSTLGDLVNNHGFLTIGDKTFSGFGWQNSDGLLNSQAGALTVTASILDGIYYLDWSGHVTVTNTSGTSGLFGDLKLTYTVTANAGLITMIDQSYIANALPGSGVITIGETVRNNLGVIVGNSTLTLNPLDLNDPVAEAGDNLILNPGEQSLLVTKDILIYAFAGYSVGISDVTQSFHQVPEPTTMVLLMFGASTLWILRKKTIA